MQDSNNLLARLAAIVGKRHVLTGTKQTDRFRKGFRSGHGEAFCVLQPGTLYEFWQCLTILVKTDAAIIFQAGNTSLTEGSIPSGKYDRDIVIINTRRLYKLQLIHDGEQVVAFPGATLNELERQLQRKGRQPHSVLGSSGLGATVVGGVCNNSGGALIERGPVYTEQALFARVTKEGELELVNHLDIDLGETPREILTRLDDRAYHNVDIRQSRRIASDTDYINHVRDLEAPTPARFNADKTRLYEASGCAGKIAVFAVRLDTFPKYERERTFYVGTNDPAALTKMRRVILSSFQTLPVYAEYMSRDTLDITQKYGKDTILLLEWLGTRHLALMYKIKSIVDSYANSIAGMKHFTDRFLQGFTGLWPDVMPRRVMAFRDKFEHCLILRAHDGGIEEAEQMLSRMASEGHLESFKCHQREAKLVILHRFAAANAAMRYLLLDAEEADEILALDIALARNSSDWRINFPAEITEKMHKSFIYGHFMCPVMHHDYLIKNGEDVDALKKAMLAILDQRGAEYPAEHNVGHLYKAKPDLAKFYRELDPTNRFNPGIGQMSRKANYL